MDTISLDDDAVLVTGAGRGLGRAYALEFGRRGARVVVNGRTPADVDAVVDEILRDGGRAVANYGSVATPEGARAAVQSAIDCFGTVHAVVNNAGSHSSGYLETLTVGQLEDMLDVHVRGQFCVTQAAWPVMREQGYGRVVITSSAAGFYGLLAQSTYAAAKGGAFGLGSALAYEGREHAILVNTIVPMATTRMATKEGGQDPVPGHGDHYPPGSRETIAPVGLPNAVAALVVYLASRSCALSGEALAAGFGRFARIFVGETHGWVAPDPATVSVEDVAAHLTAIEDLAGFAIPANMYEGVGTIAAILRSARGVD